jgi:NADH:ubiquinone reductase (H+-translocating)
VSAMPDTVDGSGNVFVIGDMASVPGVPGMAQGAIQGAKYAARAIRAELEGATPAFRKPFHYFDKGSMATVSRHSAVAKIGPLELSGYVAWVAWLALHLVYLVGFKSKIITLISWTTTFLTMNRGQLSITGRQALSPAPAERPTKSDSAVNAA